jgi:molybdopterin-guanine dinucleotide biosynthesis protein
MATKTTTDRTAEATNNLSTLVDERLRLKAELDALTERLKALDEVVIEGFQSAGLTKVQTENGKLNLIQSSTTKWNEEVLEELLTTAQWNRVTVRKVDKSRLDAELLLGRIDAIEVEVAKDIKQSKPFLR